MDKILNISNGDCAVEIMQQAGIPGIFLPWRDLLYEGPVPQGLSLTDLSRVRADYIVSRGWGNWQAINQQFIARDNTLSACADYQKIILWFEHDVYDQLQMLQIIDWLNGNANSDLIITIINTDHYLGLHSPAQMRALLDQQQPLTEQQMQLASRAWTAFSQPSPIAWWQLLEQDTSALPFLDGAILRMLEEYPNCANGLSRTELQALTIIEQGEVTAAQVFAQNQQLEAAMFFGDSGFWLLLQAFLDATPPLLSLPEQQSLTLPSTPEQKLSLTATGKEVLAGKQNWLDICGTTRWIGGVCLSKANRWCWQPKNQTLVKKENKCHT